MKLRESKVAAWGAMFIMVVCIIICVITRFVTSIWEYIPLFLAFMAVFCHLAALILYKISVSASVKLDKGALIFGILAIVSLIVVFILDWAAFY